jgi:hypothetical protein
MICRRDAPVARDVKAPTSRGEQRSRREEPLIVDSRGRGGPVTRTDAPKGAVSMGYLVKRKCYNVRGIGRREVVSLS